MLENFRTDILKGQLNQNRPLSCGGHFESQRNKKLSFCLSSLALDERLDEQNLLFQYCVIKFYSDVFSSAILTPQDVNKTKNLKGT